MSLTFLELKDISEAEIELVNPTSQEKLLQIGRLAGMADAGAGGKRLIDFGSGYAEPLLIWAEAFGITGIGIELRPKAVSRARAKIAQRGLQDLLEIIEGDGKAYAFEPGSFDYASCIGASFVWDSLPEALQALKRAIHPAGKILLGEAYWLKDTVPPELAQQQTAIHSEIWLLEKYRQVGLETEYVLHSNQDEWDHYEAANWYGLKRWIDANPNHPDLPDVIAHLHESQEEYLGFGREYFGWALYLLSSV